MAEETEEKAGGEHAYMEGKRSGHFKLDLESPAGCVFYPESGDEAPPVKHYPASGSLGKGAGKSVIEGPATESAGRGYV
jgi:hypothetical protein